MLWNSTPGHTDLRRLLTTTSPLLLQTVKAPEGASRARYHVTLTSVQTQVTGRTAVMLLQWPMSEEPQLGKENWGWRGRGGFERHLEWESPAMEARRKETEKVRNDSENITGWSKMWATGSWAIFSLVRIASREPPNSYANTYSSSHKALLWASQILYLFLSTMAFNKLEQLYLCVRDRKTDINKVSKTVCQGMDGKGHLHGDIHSIFLDTYMQF